jgi:hypothetical protein
VTTTVTPRATFPATTQAAPPVAHSAPRATQWAWLVRFIPFASLGSVGLSELYHAYKVYLWFAAIAVLAFWLGWLLRAPHLQIERKI